MDDIMENLQFAKAQIGNDEINEVVDTLRSGWLTTGPKTARFESDFSRFIGAPYSLAVNSATAGLHLALEAAGVEPGDEVITTPYTFTASAEVIRYLGADPVFIDIDHRTFNLDPEEIEKNISDRTRAVIPVHFAGQACNMTRIMEIAHRYNLKVIEDAAHALPCTHNGKKIGTIGDITVFSFYATKPITTGEGGMVVTHSEPIWRRIKTMRLHGINRDIWDRYTSSKPNWYYEVTAPGFKYNMPDIAASIGIHQLKQAERFQKRRKEIAWKYTRALADLPLKTPYIEHPSDIHSWHLYVIQLELETCRITRDRFIEKMAEKGIGTSVHFIPLHLHPYWKNRYHLNENDFPAAFNCYQRAVSLPIYSLMTDDDVSRVISAVRGILEKEEDENVVD